MVFPCNGSTFSPQDGVSGEAGDRAIVFVAKDEPSSWRIRHASRQLGRSGTRQFTLVFTLTLLLVVFGSGVVEVPLAVLVIVLPEAAVSFTVSTTLKLAALARLAAVQVTVPVPPTAGVLQVAPEGAMLTKVVPEGTASVSFTVAASGP